MATSGRQPVIRRSGRQQPRHLHRLLLAAPAKRGATGRMGLGWTGRPVAIREAVSAPRTLGAYLYESGAGGQATPAVMRPPAARPGRDTKQPSRAASSRHGPRVQRQCPAERRANAQTPTVSRLSLLKTPKRQESIEFRAPQSYRHRHAHASVRLRFAALVPGSKPRHAGTRTRRTATSVDRPAPATPRLAPSLRASSGLNRLRRPKLYRPDTAGRRSDPLLRRSETGALRAHAGRLDRKSAPLYSRAEYRRSRSSSAKRFRGQVAY